MNDTILNPHYAELAESYLFSTIARKIAEYKSAHPGAEIIKLGIGDVTTPLVPAVIDAMHRAMDEMGERATFRGYGPEQGYEFLREAVARGEYAPRSVEISPDEVSIVRTPKAGLVVGAQGEIVAALETTLTPELVREGIAREFVKNVQNLRKEADFVVDQRIRIAYNGDEEAAAAIAAFQDWICGETLADACAKGDVSGEPCDLNGHPCAIAVEKA